jgi:hypothetical protein
MGKGKLPGIAAEYNRGDKPAIGPSRGSDVPRRGADIFARWVRHPRLGVHLAILAVVLSLPSLWLGWQLDDHTFRFVLLGEGEGEMTPVRVFTLLEGDQEFNRQLIDFGHLPWWTHDRFRIAFFRYFTVLTMMLDYWLWPESPVLMHAHSLLWFAVLAAAAVVFYRQLCGPTTVAGLAAVLYVLDDARAIPAFWLANRNALTAALFGVLCLWAHDRWRRGAWKPGAALGPLLLALALASGEMGLGTIAYLAAHALFLDRAAPARRLAALAPHGVVLAIWVVIYRALGYGVEGSALYLDPVGSPLAYLGAMPGRAAFELLGQWSPVPADIAAFLSGDAQTVLWILALVVIAILACALTPLLRRDALARFWAAGMVMSLVPITATFASNRLLMFVGLGGMGLLAQFLVGVFQSAEWLPPARAWRGCVRGLAWAFVVTHLLIGPLGLASGSVSTSLLGESEKAAVATIPSDPAIAGQDLVIVNAPDFLIYVAHISALKYFAGQPYAPRIRALAPTPVPLTVSRIDDRTLDIRLDGGLFAGPLGPLFRDNRHRLRAGERIELSDLAVTVLDATPTGDVRAARFEFGVPLEDASLRWVRWVNGGYVPFTPPPVGRTVELPAARSLMDQYR